MDYIHVIKNPNIYVVINHSTPYLYL